MRATIAERLARYSIDDPISGCRLWIGAKDRKGYGRIFYKGRNGQASRIALELALGRTLAPHEHSRHRCDTPACISEAHLLVGTRDENMRDMAERGRAWRKLTEDQAVSIIFDGRRYVDIAAAFGVALSTICNIKKGKTWFTPRVNDARRKLAGNPARNVSKSLESVSVPHVQQHEATDGREVEQAYRNSEGACRHVGNG
jgi:hypothetical protein